MADHPAGKLHVLDSWLFGLYTLYQMAFQVPFRKCIWPRKSGPLAKGDFVGKPPYCSFQQTLLRRKGIIIVCSGVRLGVLIIPSTNTSVTKLHRARLWQNISCIEFKGGALEKGRDEGSQKHQGCWCLHPWLVKGQGCWYPRPVGVLGYPPLGPLQAIIRETCLKKDSSRTPAGEQALIFKVRP